MSSKIEPKTKEEIEKEIRRLKLLKLHRLEFEKYRYYSPIGKVEEFLDLTFSGKYFVTLLSAANGIGKTTSEANILANLFWPCNNPYFQQPMMKEWPFEIKKGRIISDPTTVTETIIPSLKEWFPVGRYKTPKYNTTKDGKRYEYHWTTDTGWAFDIMSYEQDPKEFESANLSFCLFDEPPPLAIYKATVARMRQGGIIIITATPLSGSSWMYDEIVTHANPEAGFRTFVTASVEDACEEHGIRGFLKHENIEKMVAQYDPEDLQARVFGKFQHLIGLVFKKWNRKVHLLTPYDLNPKDYVVVCALDNHPRNEDAVSWVAIDRKGTHYIVNELYKNFGSTAELAAAIKDVEQKNNYRVIKRLIDPSSEIVNQHDMYKRSLKAELFELGLTFDLGSKERNNAINQTKNFLNYQENNGLMIIPPQLFCFETCQRHIYEFEHWQWDEWRGRTAENKSAKEKPVDKDDHVMENVGRILLEGSVFEELVENRTVYVPQKKLDPFD